MRVLIDLLIFVATQYNYISSVLWLLFYYLQLDLLNTVSSLRISRLVESYFSLYIIQALVVNPSSSRVLIFILNISHSQCEIYVLQQWESGRGSLVAIEGLVQPCLSVEGFGEVYSLVGCVNELLIKIYYRICF